MDFAFSATGDVGTPETMAPVIVIPPGNRSVVAGSNEITLECIANARYAAGPPRGHESIIPVMRKIFSGRHITHVPALPATALSFEQLGYTHGTQGKIGTRLPKPAIAVLTLNVLWVLGAASAESPAEDEPGVQSRGCKGKS